MGGGDLQGCKSSLFTTRSVIPPSKLFLSVTLVTLTHKNFQVCFDQQKERRKVCCDKKKKLRVGFFPRAVHFIIFGEWGEQYNRQFLVERHSEKTLKISASWLPHSRNLLSTTNHQIGLAPSVPIASPLSYHKPLSHLILNSLKL